MSSSSSYVIPSLGVEKSQHLWELIKAKLASLNLYTDDVLSEYIMVLLLGGNSREKLFEDLVVFMQTPEVTEHFVLWLFEEIEKLGQVQVVQMQIPVQQAHTQAHSQAHSQVQVSDTKNSVMEQDYSMQTQQAQLSEDVQMAGNGGSSSGTRLQGNRNFSKAIEGAINPNNRNSRSEPRQSSSYQSSRYSASSSTRVTRSSSRNRSSSPQRSASSTSRRVVRSSQDDGGRVQKIKVSVDFDRDESSQRRSLTHKSTFKKQIQTDNNEDTDAGQNKIKVKCQYWPNCRSGDACPNVHPSETCKHFPNCQFGDSCTFVHPSISCKFQEKCQNPLCNYQHRPAAATTTQPGPSTSSGSTIVCKFYPRCVNINCPYLHPVKVQCRYGPDCSRPDCPFEHPSGRKGAHLKSVVFAPCKYGKQCARADCPYQHTINDTPIDGSIASITSNTTVNTDVNTNITNNNNDMQS